MKFVRPLSRAASSVAYSSQTRSLAQILLSCLADDRLRRLLPPAHARAVVSDGISDLFLTNLLLRGYSKLGLLHDARRLFDGMPHRNLVSWSSAISMYAQRGGDDEAIILFAAFRKASDEVPNEFLLAGVLRACAQSRAVPFGAQVHGIAVKLGLPVNVYVGTALINLYAKVGSMDAAMGVFDALPAKNPVTWTAVITGHSHIGQGGIALELFQKMGVEGVQPDRFVLASAVSACSALAFLEGGRQIHGYAYRTAAEIDASVINVLIDLYCKCSRPSVARRLFDRAENHNLVSWTTMIAGYMQNSFDAEAMAMFWQMSQAGWQPDVFACASILNSCGSLEAIWQGRQIHAHAIKADLESDEYVKNALIDMYAKCGHLTGARAVFDALAEDDVISYNAMIEGYARQGDLTEAVDIFCNMRYCSLRPNLLTFVSLLGVSASQSAIELSKQIHGLIIKSGTSLDLYVGSALIDVYSKCSLVDDARAVFSLMHNRDMVIWNAMIFCYAQNEQGEEAAKLFNQLRVSRKTPNEYTFVALVTVASNLASMFHGQQFHAQIVKAGVDIKPHVSNALIDMYAKCGFIKEGWLLFESTCAKDVICWNSMISTYAQHGYAAEALRIFQLMREAGVEPNYVTFVGLLSACAHAGLVDEGLRHFNSMKMKYGIEPGIEHYASVVNLFGRSGKLHAAKEFIERMPIKPAAAVWRSLLSACHLFGNVEIGKYAAEKALLVDPSDSGPYVLLSNIYASKGLWADVQKLRLGMDDAGTVKEPGYSWIEVMKEVHTFIARGREHPQAELIYSVLDELTSLLKDSGYLPDISELALLGEDC
ncbi:pentatricopeptide repeat-containing protein At4g39530-like [Phragmites australis]|uniref:pentatricopeptide repeat-containing protein At4g39530-like n=1 Tax=Phragmites australis TaxID=29695 RepID=UPI002D7A24AE|nr:pentatricopeptide repeat-containing protein At4g39530-like [Phragmites australis]XP_062232465.1 pentatricopeptide repeat-containing protein At4g39530-like [Phragmites australis]